MSAPSRQTKSVAPEWIRAANATLTAWVTFILTCAVFLVMSSLVPSWHDVTGTPAILLLLLMLGLGALTAAVVTRWQVRRMKLSATRSHIWLLVVLVIATCLTLPSLFIFMIPQ